MRQIHWFKEQYMRKKASISIEGWNISEIIKKIIQNIDGYTKQN